MIISVTIFEDENLQKYLNPENFQIVVLTFCFEIVR